LWVSAIMAGLLVMVGVSQQAVRSSSLRPGLGQSAGESALQLADQFPARLWNDPLQAARNHLDIVDPKEGDLWDQWGQAEYVVAQAAGVPDVVQRAVAAQRRSTAAAAVPKPLPGADPGTAGDRAAESADKVRYLCVVIPGESGAEASEFRLRMRFALQTGMREAGYIPASEEELSMLPVPILTDTQAPSERGRIPWINELPGDGYTFLPLPYEVFHSSNGHLPGKEGAVVVLWIDDQLLFNPVYATRNLGVLASKLQIQTEFYGEAANRPVVIALKGSDDLARLLSASRPVSDDTGDWWVGEFDVYFPISTCTHEDLRERAAFHSQVRLRASGAEAGGALPDSFQGGDWSFVNADSRTITRASISRVLPTDDEVFQVLLRELEARIPGLGDREVKEGEERPEIILVTESDTFYSRSIVGTFRGAYADLFLDGESQSQPAKQATHLVGNRTYLRGIDGNLPAPEQSDGESSGLLTPGSGDSPGLMQLLYGMVFAPRQSNQQLIGRRQTDYLERMADALLASQMKLSPQERVRAIGVLGSDTYDKIQAIDIFRQRFPGLLFFTEGMDAQYLEAASGGYLRNLLVAGVDLSAPSAATETVFRDANQVAFYLALRDALGKPAEPTPLEVWEVGRSRFVSSRPAGTRANPEFQVVPKVTALDMAKPSAVLRPESSDRPPRLNFLMVFGVFLVGIALLRIASVGFPRFARRASVWLRKRWPRLRQSPVPGEFWGLRLMPLLFLPLGMFLVWIGYAMKGLAVSGGEPLELFEGVSVWPSVLLRAGAIVLGIFWFWRSTRLAVDIKALPSTVTGATQRPTLPQRLSAMARHVGAVLVCSILFLALIFGVQLLLGNQQGFNTPARGFLAWLLSTTTAAGSLALFLLVLWSSMMLHCQTSARLLGWRGKILAGEKADPEVLRSIAEKTNEVSGTVLFPFGVLILMLFARHPIFDNWNQPALLWIMSFLALISLLGAAFTLVGAAGEMKRVVRRAERVRKQQVENEEEEALDIGIFQSWRQSPALQAILLAAFGIGTTYVESLIGILG